MVCNMNSIWSVFLVLCIICGIAAGVVLFLAPLYRKNADVNVYQYGPGINNLHLFFKINDFLSFIVTFELEYTTNLSNTRDVTIGSKEDLADHVNHFPLLFLPLHIMYRCS